MTEESTNSATVETTTTETTPEVSRDERVATFAEQLRAENAGRKPEPSESNDGKVAQPKAGGAEPKTVDREALLKAFRSGDVKKLAEILEEKEPGKIANSDWAKHRIAQREHRRQVEEFEARARQEREAIAKEREQILSSSSTIGKAMDALNRGDLVSYLEISTGRPIKDLVDELADDLTDPNKREMRALRNEREREKREREEFERKAAQENQTREQAAAKARYMSTLKEAIAQDETAAPILAEYGDAFAQLVFDEQARNWDGETPMPVAKAAANVIKQQRAYFERAAKVFGSLSGDAAPGAKPAKQGSPGARLAPRKSSTTGQGGPVKSRQLTPQEERAHYAHLLRIENSSR